MNYHACRKCKGIFIISRNIISNTNDEHIICVPWSSWPALVFTEVKSVTLNVYQYEMSIPYELIITATINYISYTYIYNTILYQTFPLLLMWAGRIQKFNKPGPEYQESCNVQVY
jgi:hypothetical protein